MRKVLYVVAAIVCGGATAARACPPVAVSQGVAAPLAIAVPQTFAVQPQFVAAAPVAQAIAGFGLALPTAAVSVVQPVALASISLVAAPVISASSACGAACVRGGAMCGGRARLLPRQRSVARTEIGRAHV